MKKIYNEVMENLEIGPRSLEILCKAKKRGSTHQQRKTEILKLLFTGQSKVDLIIAQRDGHSVIKN